MARKMNFSLFQSLYVHLNLKDTVAKKSIFRLDLAFYMWSVAQISTYGQRLCGNVIGFNPTQIELAG